MISRWIVHKFGGTSLADTERYWAATEIVLSREANVGTAVVVSAMSGVYQRPHILDFDRHESAIHGQVGARAES